MCGLAGFWTAGLQSAFPLDTAQAMAACLTSRGPDDAGQWGDLGAGFAVGHRRLSVVDLSHAGHQPMHSADQRWVLAYNGEIYNHLALRAQLEAEGKVPAWLGHSDTETLLACFDAWSIERTLRACVGMFAIALWDRKTSELTLARDRIGEKPLYYGWQGETLLFGSELKALKAHPDFAASIDRGALSMLLRFNYIPAPYCIYEGIHKLLPGTFLRIGKGQRDAVPQRYWSLAEVAEHGTEHPFRGSEADALAGLEARLSHAVQGQAIADVPLGALLSGGIDSTAITALMQVNSTQRVRTFTIGFDEKQYDEASHSRAVAAHLGTEHTELRLGGNDALDLVPRMPEMYDEPFADSSQLPTHLVMKLARQHVTVALSGDAGDELFGGYNRYVLGPKVWRRISRMPPLMRRATGAALTMLPAKSLNQLLGPIASRAGIAQPGDKAHKLGSRLQSVHSIDDLLVSLVSEWGGAADIVIGGHMPPNLLDDRAAWPKLPDPVARMMALDSLTYLPDDIMTKVDRASMAVSLETRTPFLDRNVIEFAWSLPMHMKVRDGRGKWLLRQLVSRHVPDALMDRPKMGFGIPLDDWLRGPLRAWVEALLDEDRLRREGYFHPAPIRTTWARHLAGSSCGYRLWSVLMFQAWLEHQGTAH